MKKRLVATCLLTVLSFVLVLTGCSVKKAENGNDTTTDFKELDKIEHIEQVPDAFKTIVENNIFEGITAFEAKILKAEVCSADEKNKTVMQKVEMMDTYGNALADYTVSSEDAYHITTLTATSDGGFLFVLGFQDYAYERGGWASDKEFASRIIKCGKDGKLQFDIPLEWVEGAALKFCFEKDGKFYFFGTIETPETKNQGVHSYTDIYMCVLNESGVVIEIKSIAGSDFDSLTAAELADEGFILSVNSQSDDGDFSGSNSKGYPVDWVITVNDELEITEKKIESGRQYSDTKIGEKEGRPIYKSDDLLKGFDAGTPTAFIDYGDFYLIVSENITGQYENTPPMVNSIWCYTETVYSGYDENGNLIFRTAVDSSPDYDAMEQSYLKT